jgi:hypothetical protein
MPLRWRAAASCARRAASARTCDAEVVLRGQRQHGGPLPAEGHLGVLVRAHPLKLAVGLCRARLVVRVRALSSRLQPAFMRASVQVLESRMETASALAGHLG